MKEPYPYFGDLDPSFTDPSTSKVIILPIPYELTTTYLHGTDRAPRAILNASWQLELFDEETREEPFKVGIHTCPELEFRTDNPEESLRLIEEEAFRWIDKGKFLVSLGGEHTLTLGLIRAFQRRYPSMSLLQLDAHADLKEEYEGSRWNHACVMRRAVELCHIVQVGIRSLSCEEADYVDREGITIHFAHQIRKGRAWMEKVIKELRDPVYLTIDMDYFDPSLVPMVSTPEPGGLSWHGTLDLLKSLTEQRNVVGMDVVELCPKEGFIASDFITARLIYKFLAYRFRSTDR